MTFTFFLGVIHLNKDENLAFNRKIIVFSIVRFDGTAFTSFSN